MAKTGKAIKQHYNQILKDPEERERHFAPSGALGSEKEGREPGRLLDITIHNQEARESLMADSNKVVDDRLEQLKRAGKIKLG